MSTPARSVTLIWAQSRSGVIGAAGAIPWRIPEDMRQFKAVTMGHPVVMGRRTWDSIPPRFRPFSGRRNIVVSRQPDWSGEGAERADSVAAAIEHCAPDPVYIAGGGEIYRIAMDLATDLRVTEVDIEVDGDTEAPLIGAEWTAQDAPWQESETGTRFRVLHYTRAS